MNAPPRLWSVATVAKRLGVSRAMIFRQIRARRMSAIRIGRFWRVEPSAVDEYIARQRQVADVPEPEPPAVDDRQLALFEPPGDDRLSLAEEEAAIVDGVQTLGKLEALAERDAMIAAADAALAEAAAVCPHRRVTVAPEHKPSATGRTCQHDTICVACGTVVGVDSYRIGRNGRHGVVDRAAAEEG